MKKWLNTFARFGKDKKYVLLLSLVAACGYGFMVTHQTIGIDDTPYEYYFEDGLAAIVGRWVLFLLNKILNFSDFAPFITDLVGVLLLMVAVTVWCSLFYRIFEEKIPRYGYYFFACVMLSCPLISEVFTYYLHNGVGIGYLASGVSLCLFYEMQVAYEERSAYKKGKTLTAGKEKLQGSIGENTEVTKRLLLCLIGCAVCMVVALGCYESFMMVWLAGALLILLSERILGKKRNIWISGLTVGIIGALGMVLRSVMIQVVTIGFGLGDMKDEAVQRSITEMVGWLVEDGALAEFAMVLKRMLVMYGVFAYAYYPIAIFVLAAVVMLVVALWKSIQKKDAWISIIYIGVFVASFLLIVIEGKATLYRSAQFLPLICGFGVLMLCYMAGEVSRWKKLQDIEPMKADKLAQGDKPAQNAKDSQRSASVRGKIRMTVHAIAIFTCTVIVWNQCTDMNKWFYIDYMKYEDAKNTMEQIAKELESDFDTSKPVVFTGTYDLPRGIVQAAYVPYGSETFYKINSITTKIDEHLLEKFYRDYGVWVAQTPSLSVIDWARYAFDNDEEMIRFFGMHGYELVPLLDTSIYPIAEEYSLTLPEFPQEGSIVDMGEYIIVHM